MSNLASIFGAGFDTNTVEPQGDFEVILPGKVPVIFDKSEVKQTKKQDGYYLELAMTIIDGEYRNRKLWDRINIQNPSQQCVDIGLRQLSALGKATGVAYVSDENQFLGKTCIAHVKVKGGQNEIRTYSAMEGPCDTQLVAPQQNEQAVGRCYTRQPVAPVQMQPPMQPPTVQSPTASQVATAEPVGRGVGPTGAPATGTPPWQRKPADEIPF